MKEYYANRANEYEEIYQKPERKSSIEDTNRILIEFLKNRKVFEVACGTGYWTQTISKSAKSIIATDINSEVIDIAKKKIYSCPVEFNICDSLKAEIKNEYCDAGFAGFWFSHLIKEERIDFIQKLNVNLVPKSKVCFIDNKFIESESTKISRTDGNGNTFQMRKLHNGGQYEIVKNFPCQNELKELLLVYGDNIIYDETKYYWIIQYETKFQNTVNIF